MPPAVARRCDAVADRCLPVFKVCFFGLHECRFYFAKIMQTSGKRACFQFPECRLSYAKIMKGECNSKLEKRSFSIFDTAEPHLILCKDNANEWKRELAFNFPSAGYLMQR